LKAAHLCGQLSFRQFATGTSLKLRDVSGLLARHALTFRAQLTLRQSDMAPATTIRARQLTALASRQPAIGDCAPAAAIASVTRRTRTRSRSRAFSLR
jgi:hypothetical protein